MRHDDDLLEICNRCDDKFPKSEMINSKANGSGDLYCDSCYSHMLENEAGCYD